MRGLAIVVLVLGPATPAAADPFERVDTIGAVSAVTWDGRPSAGLHVRIVLVERLALAATARARERDKKLDDGMATRSDGELVENLDLIFQLTDGKLESTFGGSDYPIRLDLIAGVGAVERQRYATASYGAAMRIRVTRNFTIDIAVRDEVSRVPRPNRFVHVPEVQLALSWTGRRFTVEPAGSDSDD